MTTPTDDLWAVQYGETLTPTYDKAQAERLATLAGFLDLPSKAVPWPGTAEEHAAELARDKRDEDGDESETAEA